MNINFKPAAIADVALLLSFMQQLYEQDGAVFEPARAEAALLRLLNDPTLGRIWLICHEAEAIGYGVLTLGYSLEFGGQDAFIDELFVQKDYRGQGVGTKTLDFLESMCQELEIKALHLEVEHENAKAQQFYRKVGFGDRHYYLMTKRIQQSSGNTHA
ncbi:MAG: GNAT family N-acetyltransferase [Oculatellaceae cyanobacterium bins.114]|nr:GNAT family N-acetyltransferase [Oculatellaceae cyanobacterium bins.114]